MHFLIKICQTTPKTMTDIQKLRDDFPLLADRSNNKPVVYFDTACQSLRPTVVMDAILRYYTEEPACAGRSMHHLAASVTRDVDQARKLVARHINASRSEEIIFTRNTTEAINLVANSLGLVKGDIVLITDKEHNSNLIPWQQLARQEGIIIKIVPSLPDNTFDLSSYEDCLNDEVKLISMVLTSNLDGVTIPAEEIIKKAHRKGALVLLDAAQATPHQKIDAKSLDVDFMAFSGHKMLGPSGTGILYGKYRLLEKMRPFIVGGDTVASSTYETCEFLPPPAKFEAGLQNYAGIIGLGAAIQYLNEVGFHNIQKQELELNQFITRETRDLEGLHLIGPMDARFRGGIFSFYIENLDHHRIALMLDQMANIVVRSGQHCVHSWFHAHGIPGSVRASMYFYNTLAEAENLVSNLRKIRKVL
jgi:cysteine desulfurase/selenocysteine lyase